MKSLLGNADETEWTDMVGQFRAKAQEFQTAFDNLKLQQPSVVGTTLEAEWRRLIRSGETVRNTINNVTAAIDRASQWLDSVGLGGTEQLSAAWLLPFSVVVGGISAMSIFLSKYAQWQQRWNEYERLIGEGRTPEQAKDLVNQIAQPTSTIFSELSRVVLPIIGIGAIWWFARKK